MSGKGKKRPDKTRTVKVVVLYPPGPLYGTCWDPILNVRNNVETKFVFKKGLGAVIFIASEKKKKVMNMSQIFFLCHNFSASFVSQSNCRSDYYIRLDMRMRYYA